MGQSRSVRRLGAALLAASWIIVMLGRTPATTADGPPGTRVILPGIARDSAPAGGTVFNYDFEGGTADWILDPAAWSWTGSSGTHVLRGSGHGFARLAEHSGNISSLRFRFRLESAKSTFHANSQESFAGGHTRYFVSFASGGVGLTRQQGETFQSLGEEPSSFAPGVFHDVQVLLGGGSMDVFVDGEAVIGADDSAPLPPGRVSFESFADEPVQIDDIAVTIDGEQEPHARAPRSPLSLPPGPDVGPFVGGAHSGDITLSGSQVITLAKGRYTVKEGNLTLRDEARLRIEEGAALVFERGTSPLIHWGLDLGGRSALEKAGGNVVSETGLVRVNAFGRSRVDIVDARPRIHFINAGDEATITILRSRLVTAIGGSLQVSGSTTADVRDSKVGAIALAAPAGSRLRASGLGTGTFADFDLRRDLNTAGLDYNLRLRNVELVPDTIGEGPYERGWIVFADEKADVELRQSTLRKLVVELTGAGAAISVSGLRLGQSTDLTVGQVRASGLTVTGQWGFFVHGSRELTVEDSDAIWLFLFDSAKAHLRRSTMNEFDPRQYTGTLDFEEGEWNTAGEIIEGNDFVMAGTYRVGPGVRETLSWATSAVTRRFPILVRDAGGQPLAGVTLTFTRGNSSVTATTDTAGAATVELRFTDGDYPQPWQLTTSAGHPARPVDFFSDTPIVIQYQPGEAAPVLEQLAEALNRIDDRHLSLDGHSLTPTPTRLLYHAVAPAPRGLRKTSAAAIFRGP